jgi:hypothetical protein
VDSHASLPVSELERSNQLQNTIMCAHDVLFRVPNYNFLIPPLAVASLLSCEVELTSIEYSISPYNKKKHKLQSILEASPAP